MIEQSISLERMEDTASLFGPFDENIRLIERELHVQIVIREEELRISGEAEQVMYAEKTIQSLLALGARGEAINEQNIRYVLQLVLQGQEEKVNDLARDVVCVTAAGKPIKAKTVGQTAYVRAIQNNVVTLGVGPAGTGKTYLAVAMAVAAFKAQAGQPHHPDPSGGGSRRAAGFFARRLAEQGRPVPPPPLRRPL